MKKNILLILAAALTLSVVSCTKTSLGVTRITYYPTIELQGDDPYVISKGGSYTEPGFTAMLNGEDISSQVEIASNVKTDQVGIYKVQYSCVNSDGISASASRTVIVVNPTTSIENVYSVYCSYGARNFTNPMLVKAVSGGYSIPDWFGGFYCLGRYPGYEAYGYDFWADAVFSVGADNTISLVDYDNGWYFADSWDETPTESGYDPATGVIYWVIEDSLLVELTPYSVN